MADVSCITVLDQNILDLCICNRVRLWNL